VHNHDKVYKCGKRWFLTATMASTAMRTIQQSADCNPYKTPVSVYRCPTCDGFHLSSWPRDYASSTPTASTGENHARA
jgi:hypothetical protein